uniref:WGS project CBMG000000000 data, contig CS5907-c001242 n=1 Tax=Fusarium acuminatum CS5907 TaxID=1318461 RepID=A0A096PFL3_9HYPO|nr:unnamed protein product [Fusarium acuminatum CS5907]
MSCLNTPQLKKLWEQVQTKPEWATTKFWEYVFKENVFGSSRWAIASQQPPTDDENDLRRVDLVVENIDENGNSATLLFMEAKKANVTLDQIDVVEYQAFTACCAHLSYTRRSCIWAMTCVGSKTRLWAYRSNDDYLTPFWPLGDGLSDRAEYLEYSVHGEEILRKLNFIKKNPMPGLDVFERPPSPRPTSPSLPQNWHDSEVNYMIPTAPPLTYTASGSDWQTHEPPIDAYGSQSQSLEATQVPTINANDALEVVVDKHEKGMYKCNIVIDNGRIHVLDGAWVECYINVSGQLHPGYSWRGKSGRQYYTWSLEPEQKAKKKRH